MRLNLFEVNQFTLLIDEDLGFETQLLIILDSSISALQK